MIEEALKTSFSPLRLVTILRAYGANHRILKLDVWTLVAGQAMANIILSSVAMTFSVCTARFFALHLLHGAAVEILQEDGNAWHVFSPQMNPTDPAILELYLHVPIRKEIMTSDVWFLSRKRVGCYPHESKRDFSSFLQKESVQRSKATTHSLVQKAAILLLRVV